MVPPPRKHSARLPATWDDAAGGKPAARPGDLTTFTPIFPVAHISGHLPNSPGQIGHFLDSCYFCMPGSLYAHHIRAASRRTEGVAPVRGPQGIPATVGAARGKPGRIWRSAAAPADGRGADGRPGPPLAADA